MNVEVLISTMHQKNHDLINKMNLKTNAVIINQTDCNRFDEIKINDKCIKIFSSDERGIAKSRNLALKHSHGEICILADDDMIFLDNYKETATKVFSENNNADVIIFNLFEDTDKANRKNASHKKIGIFNYMNYGAARIAFRNKSIKNNNIQFKTDINNAPLPTFGEDTLFLRDCLKKGLKIIAVPDALASLNSNRKSTWFNGYTKEYFFDKGVILALAHPLLSIPFALFLVVKHKEYSESGITKLKIFKEIFKGILFVTKSRI